MACLAACGEPDVPTGHASVGVDHAEWLVDVTGDTGLSFVHDSGVDGSFYMPEVIGSGAALFDYDGDGDLDLYLIDSGRHGQGAVGGRNRLLAQEPGPVFVDRTAESGLGDDGYGMGVALGDIDNDGDLDVFVTNHGPDALYRNEGDGTFLDVTSRSGIGGAAWSTSAVFFDYDVDGYLDLFVTTYVIDEPPKDCTTASGRREYCGPNAYRGTPDQLYRNQGHGSFVDVSDATGIGAAPGKGLGVVTGDFDGDRRADIYVANDGEKNFLWLNRGDGRFEDEAVVMGTAYNIFGKPEASMGIAFGDVDGDLTPDLFVTHLSRETNTLYRTLPQGGLQDATAMSGLGPPSLPYTGFGTGFLDVDHDGALDLIVVNGRVTLRDTRGAPADDGDPLERFRDFYAEPNQLFVNDGAGRFDNACDRAVAFCEAEEVSRGTVFGDVDGDGDLDVLVTNGNGPARLYRNDVPKRGNWVKVRALLPERKRDAIGAQVYADTGQGRYVRPVRHTYGYLASADATVHFGIGPAPRVEQFTVIWPDGSAETFPGADAGETLSLLRGEGTAAP